MSAISSSRYENSIRNVEGGVGVLLKSHCHTHLCDLVWSPPPCVLQVEVWRLAPVPPRVEQDLNDGHVVVRARNVHRRDLQRL